MHSDGLFILNLTNLYNEDPTLIGLLQKLLDLRGSIFSLRGVTEATFNEQCKCTNIILPFQFFPSTNNYNTSTFSLKLSISVLEQNNCSIATIFTDLSILNSASFTLIPFTKEVSPVIAKSATIKTRNNESNEDPNPLPSIRYIIYIFF